MSVADRIKDPPHADLGKGRAEVMPSRVSTGRYLFVVAASFCALLALAAVNAWAQVGAPTKHGWYTCSYIRSKISTGSAMDSPKLVIVSGSNALMGIDVGALSRGLGIRGFNFGLAASFGPGFQSYEAAKILHRGDAVLMPLEYLAYDYSTPADSLVDAVYSCGADYWKTLGWREKLFFVMAAKPFRLFDSFLFRMRSRAVADIAAVAASDAGPLGQGVGRRALLRVATAEPDLRKHPPLAIRFDVGSAGARAIAQFVGWAKAHGIAVFATWPSTLYFPQYDGLPAFRQIRVFYQRLGVSVIGTPRESMFPASLMADSVYHLNSAGMKLNTEKLANALRLDPGFLAWQRANTRAHRAEQPR